MKKQTYPRVADRLREEKEKNLDFDSVETNALAMLDGAKQTQGEETSSNHKMF